MPLMLSVSVAVSQTFSVSFVVSLAPIFRCVRKCFVISVTLSKSSAMALVVYDPIGITGGGVTITVGGVTVGIVGVVVHVFTITVHVFVGIVGFVGGVVVPVFTVVHVLVIVPVFMIVHVFIGGVTITTGFLL